MTEEDRARATLHRFLDMIPIDTIASEKIDPEHDNGYGVGELYIDAIHITYCAAGISIYIGDDDEPWHWDINDMGGGPIAVGPQ